MLSKNVHNGVYSALGKLHFSKLDYFTVTPMPEHQDCQLKLKIDAIWTNRLKYHKI